MILAMHWVTDFLKKPLFDKETQGSHLSFFLMAGPISLVATLSIALQKISNLDLAFACAIALFFCFSMKTKGLFYALFVLCCSAFFKHFFFLNEHLWQVGVECSCALGFLITSFSAELFDLKQSCMVNEMQGRAQQIGSLEAIIRERDEERASLQRAVEAYQKQEREWKAQIASLEILNEVLRQSGAKKVAAEEEIIAKERRIAELLDEMAERSFVSNQDEWVDEKRNLLNELDLARSEKEQSYLINETLVRMHATSEKKAKEQQMLFEQILSEKEALSRKLSEKERALPLFEELADEKSLRELNELRAQHAQLREQFEQKNVILHQTRRELFRIDTLLQAHQNNEMQAKEELPLHESLLCRELIQLAKENSSLEKENRELFDLATDLMHSKE